MKIDRVFLYCVAGLVAVALYLALPLILKRRWPRPELGPAVSAFLSGPGIVAAIWLAYQGITPSPEMRALPDSGELRLYLVLGALSLGWVSCVLLGKECRVALAERTSARGGDDDPGRSPQR